MPEQRAVPPITTPIIDPNPELDRLIELLDQLYRGYFLMNKTPMDAMSRYNNLMRQYERALQKHEQNHEAQFRDGGRYGNRVEPTS